MLFIIFFIKLFFKEIGFVNTDINEDIRITYKFYLYELFINTEN